MKKMIAKHSTTKGKIFEDQKLFQQLAEKFRDIFWVFDLGTDEMVFVNSGCLEVWGGTWKSIDDWQKAIHPDDRNWVQQAALLKRSTGEYNETYRMHQLDGTVRWIHEQTFPIHDETGAIYRIVGIADDITDFKNAKEASRESEERFRQIAENINEVLWMESLESDQLLYVSSVYEKIWGRTCQSLHDDPSSFMKTVFSEDRIHFNTHLKKQRDGSSSELEYRITKPDGSIRWIRDRSFPIKHNNGKVYRTAGMSEDITERKNAEDALQQSEALKSAIIGTALDAIISIDHEGKILEFNPAAEKIFGYRSVEVLGKTMAEFIIPPSLREKHHKGFAQHIATGKASILGQRIQISAMRADGTEFPVELTICKIPTAGKPKFTAFIRDITKRKQAEIALRENEERYRALYEDNPSMYFTIAEDGTVLSVNSFGAEQLGYTVKELIDQSVLGVFYHEDKDKAQKQLFTCLQNPQESHTWELRKVRKNGSMLWVREHARVVKHIDGQLVVLIVCNDITHQKETEIAFRESEERFRIAFASTPVGMALIKTECNFLQVNPALCKIVGYSEKELMKTTLKDITHPEDMEACGVLLKQLLSGEFNSRQMEKRYIHKEGRIVWALLSISVVNDREDEPQYFVAQISDISEHKKMQGQIQQYTNNLEQLVNERTTKVKELEQQRMEGEKLAATGRMAARIAHEINNPLGGIKNSFALIKEAVPGDHPYFEFVGRIEKEIDRIARVVRQMFSLYKPDQVLNQQFKIDETVRDIVALVEPSRRERCVTMKINADPSLPWVVMSEGLLRQILFNIIQNAIEASSANGVVMIDVRADDKNLIITVSDQGSGIAKELHSEIFTPFFTTKRSLINAGLGLGLSVCKDITNAMKGTLTFESEVGQGTIFRISLPLNATEPGEVQNV